MFKNLKLPWWLRWLLIIPALILIFLYLLSLIGIDPFNIGSKFGWNLHKTNNGSVGGNSYKGYSDLKKGEELSFLQKWLNTVHDHIFHSPNIFIPHVINDFQNFSNQHKHWVIHEWIKVVAHKRYLKEQRYRLNDLLLDVSPSSGEYDNAIMAILNIEKGYEPINQTNWSTPSGVISFTG